MLLYKKSIVHLKNICLTFKNWKSEAKPFETIDQLEQTSFTIGAQMGTAYQNMFRVGIIEKDATISSRRFCAPGDSVMTSASARAHA